MARDPETAACARSGLPATSAAVAASPAAVRNPRRRSPWAITAADSSSHEGLMSSHARQAKATKQYILHNFVRPRGDARARPPAGRRTLPLLLPRASILRVDAT